MTDPVWDKAGSLLVETKGGPDVVFRAVTSGENVYIQASWADSTKNDMDTPWIYEGGSWRKDPGDDVIILLWNIGNSIKGFNRRGAAVVKQTPRDFARVRGFTIEGEKPATGLWDGLEQEGDIWDLALGLTNPLALANDLYFGIDTEYVKNPETTKPRLVTHSDSYTAGAPWQKNIKEGADGIKRPMYRFRPGFTANNTPFPTLNEMAVIREDDTFAPGEVAPYYIFEKGKNWGGSMDDVVGKGVWEEGTWRTEMRRKLDTGHEDDITFSLKNDQNYFVFSAMVRDGDSDYYTSPPIALEITK